MISYTGNSLATWIDAGIENSDTFLMVNSCGYQKFLTRDYVISRAKGRVDFLLIYIIDGKGHYRFPQGETEIEKGNILFYRPEQPQFYEYRFRDKPELYWLHFTGTAVPTLLESLSFSGNPPFYVGIDGDCIELIRKIIGELIIKKPSFETLASAYLLQLLARLSRLAGTGDKPSGSDDIDHIVGFLHSDYNRRLTIDELAEKCRLSKSRFIHKFKVATGKAPMEYVTQIRINEAKNLLSYSNLNISQVSAMVGYENPLYFSRIFRRETGISPSDFKRAMS